jgi:hypothetical protein
MGWVFNTMPQPLYPRERPSTHCTGGWVGPTASLNKCGKSPPPRARIQSLDCPAHSELLYWLSYQGLFGIYIYTHTHMYVCKHRCTNLEWQVTWATEFHVVAPNICGFSIWNLFRVTLLATRTLRWLLDIPRHEFTCFMCMQTYFTHFKTDITHYIHITWGLTTNRWQCQAMYPCI